MNKKKSVVRFYFLFCVAKFSILFFLHKNLLLLILFFSFWELHKYHQTHSSQIYLNFSYIFFYYLNFLFVCLCLWPPLLFLADLITLICSKTCSILRKFRQSYLATNRCFRQISIKLNSGCHFSHDFAYTLLKFAQH